MLFYSTEVNIQFMEVLKKSAERCTFGHFSKSIDILREALATISELTIRTRHIGVGVVDITRKEHTSVDFAPIAAHLLAILTASIKVSHLVCPKHIVHVFGEFCLQWSHHSKLLAYEYLGEEFVSASEHHGLLVEVFDKSALGKELWHVAHLMICCLREFLAGARQDGGPYEHGHIRKIGDELFHKCQILGTIIFGGNMYLQKRNVDVAQIVIITFWRVADKEFTLWIVVF